VAPEECLERVAYSAVGHLLAPVVPDDDQIESVFFGMSGDGLRRIVGQHDVSGDLPFSLGLVPYSREALGEVLPLGFRGTRHLFGGFGMCRWTHDEEYVYFTAEICGEGDGHVQCVLRLAGAVEADQDASEHTTRSPSGARPVRFHRSTSSSKPCGERKHGQ
jgi:hypothetical protein